MTTTAPSDPTAIVWSDAARQAAFAHWFQQQAVAQGLRPDSLRPASADASFRRYFRADRDAAHGGGTVVVMDAPPAQENCRPFVDVAALLRAAGVRVPDILAWDEPQGFMLLSDLGDQTLLTALDPARPAAALPHFQDATAALLDWQQTSRPGVLPAYDEALLRRELQLFPDWYLAQHKGVALDDAGRATLARTFDLIVERNLAAPSVFVHRDFMPRNLMLPRADDPNQRLGVLDFQDAVYGPITYDIACLMRDAFLTWEEDTVLDVTIRYWERARKRGMMDFDGWSEDFGAFYRAVEWMGLQRHLKVAGIFARLTLRDGKPKYLADAPRFIHYIRGTALRYRELAPLVRLIDKVEGWEAASGFAYGRV
ncbi:aminoglycoside phosphotransferase family protein [Aquabacterium sp. A08]|uniref:aminoglycoside phosphotransferase family protein n=1 Tax=Aquabacterium sp. A08 TaxID=2718532 RepID=UPI00141EC481|nr:phosphotransferase [Aquabacterium sp. A08]NIC41606.1 phosphotransferase [Aquabacterium sp. A08]